MYNLCGAEESAAEVGSILRGLTNIHICILHKSPDITWQSLH
jgi:hypothetical protein